MNVLWLGPRSEAVEAFLGSQGDAVTFVEAPVAPGDACLDGKNFLASFGYRHLVPDAVLALFPRCSANVHISYLPWNRGADPNLWSFLEDTPKGVSVHCMTSRLDGGDIFARKEIAFSGAETLRSSYETLSKAALDLFFELWPRLKKGDAEAAPQPSRGSYHRKADKGPYAHLLTRGWDTPVKDLAGKALSPKGGAQ